MLKDQEIPTFDPEIYTQVPLNELVTYAVFHLKNTRERISAENITAASFLLFPKRFSLRGYPQWPDSTVVNKRWIDIRKRGLIMGSTASDFSLTPRGLEVAEQVERKLRGQKIYARKPSNTARTEIRTRAGKFVRIVEESDAFVHYKKNGNLTSLGEFDFRNMLLCTMESSASTLRNNLEQFKQYVMEYDRKDLLAFLELCEKRFRGNLNDRISPAGIVRGGMLRKKSNQ